MHGVHAEEQSRAQDQQQPGHRGHTRIGRADHPPVTGVDAVEPYAQRHNRREHRHGAQHHPLPSGRHETHQVAGVRPQEPQVRRQDRLIPDADLEMLDDRDDDRHRQQHRSGDPEAVDQHQQHHVDDADQDHVEHQYEVGLGEHLHDQVAQPHQRAGKLHARAGHRHAPLQDGDRREVEHQEQHRVQPPGEWLVPTFRPRLRAFDIQFLDVGHACRFAHILHHGVRARSFLDAYSHHCGHGTRVLQVNGRFLYDCFQTIR